MRLFQAGSAIPYRVLLRVQRWQRLLALPILMWPLVACTQPIAMYEGERLPQDAVATLERVVSLSGGIFYRTQWAFVKKVDGIEPPGIIRNELELLPGRRTASLDLRKEIPLCSFYGCINISVAEPSITFVAEAGHTYCIPALKKEEQVWIWVLDAATGKTVAGVEPIDFELSCKCIPESFWTYWRSDCTFKER